MAQDGSPTKPELPAVTVQSSRDSAAAPMVDGVDAERARLARVPGGTNLVEPQQQSRLATLRDALDYQPGIVIQDFFGGTDQPRLSIRGSGIQSNPVNRGVLLLQDGLPLNEADGSFIIGFLEPRNAALVSARRGANALTPGATTLGGELDFVSLTGAQERGRVRAETGSYGRQALQAAVGGVGERFDSRISASSDRFDGYRHHSASSRDSVQANLGFQGDGSFENRTYLSWTDLSFQIPSVVPKDRIASNPRGVMGDGVTAQDQLLNVYKRDPRLWIKRKALSIQKQAPPPPKAWRAAPSSRPQPHPALRWGPTRWSLPHRAQAQHLPGSSLLSSPRPLCASTPMAPLPSPSTAWTLARACKPACP